MGNMESAHPLVEVNVSFKFEGNPSISKGIIERTRIGDGPTDRPTDRPTDATNRTEQNRRFIDLNCYGFCQVQHKHMNNK